MLKKSDLLKLPEEVRDFILESSEAQTEEVAAKFSVVDQQLIFLFDLQDEIFLKNIEVLDFPNQLQNMPQGEKIDLRALAVAIALENFWPLQDYLGGQVTSLILRLGGKVPMNATHLRPAAVNKDDFPQREINSIKALLQKYADFKNLPLTTHKIIDREGKKVAPTVDNWIRDYIHFLGAGQHNTLQRSQYLSKSKNIAELNQIEQEVMRYFLTSYDEGMEVDVVLSDGLVRVSSVKKESDVVKDSKTETLESTLAYLREKIAVWEQKLLPSDFILSEAENHVTKVRDILWQSLGMQDQAKIVSCLRVLVEKKAADQMLQEDNRFKSILKRFINIRYGHETENWFEQNADKNLRWRLFLEMVLVDKLHLSMDQAAAVCVYLSNIWPDSSPVVYLDENTGQMDWLGVHSSDSKLGWVEALPAAG